MNNLIVNAKSTIETLKPSTSLIISGGIVVSNYTIGTSRLVDSLNEELKLNDQEIKQDTNALVEALDVSDAAVDNSVPLDDQ